MRSVQSLTDITLADAERVGAKAAHLGAMLRAGFPVPPGFVIDVDAFTEHFGPVTNPLVKPVVPRVQSELMAEVVQVLVEVLGDSPQLAVRSSSTQEDAHEASYAGQHSTYYFVRPQELDQAIVDCWMSLWSPAALAYRRAGWNQIASNEPVRMAVIVQHMLPATRSGVAFSRDPVSGQPDCVIEATWGLGAALVDGRVSPDHIRVSEHGTLSDYTVSDKRLQVRPSNRNVDGNRLQEVSRERRQAPVLTAPEAERIANLCQQLETLFEGPQDVEWSFVEDELYLLQSRPITAQNRITRIERKLVLFKPLAENFTEPLTPLTEDLYASVLPDIGAFCNGRLYLDVGLIAKTLPFELSDREIADLVLLKSKPEDMTVKGSRAAAGVALLGLGFLVDGANWIRAARCNVEALSTYPASLETIINNPTISPIHAMRRLVWGRHPFEPISRKMFVLNVSAGRYFLYIGLLTALVKRFAPDYPIAQLSRTYHGRRDMQSLVMLEDLQSLNASLAATLAQDTEESRQIAQVLADRETLLPEGNQFTVTFEGFLHKYGHRGPREMELAAPRWHESPSAVLQLLHNGTSPTRPDAHGAFLAARDELHGHLKPWQRRIVEYLCNTISHFIALRENTRHYHTLVLAGIRAKVLNEERALIDAEKLKLTGDIFFLRFDEIDALREGRLDVADAQASVRRRRRDWQRRAREYPVETFNLSLGEKPATGDDIQGRCASPGVCEGIVRIVMSPQQGRDLKSGEVLVAPYTDPAWTPLFLRAGAVVLGTGSFLSHAGTVARELQIPCVVDVENATQRLKTGQRVRVDATAGTVEVLAS